MARVVKPESPTLDASASESPHEESGEALDFESEACWVEHSDGSDGQLPTPVAPLTPRSVSDPEIPQPPGKRRVEHQSSEDGHERVWPGKPDYLEDERKQRQKLRRKHSHLRQARQLEQKPAWWPSAKLPRPDVLAALRKPHECPVGRPDEGAPILRMMPAELVLCITDHLCFPDVFALAMTCKSMHQTINLKSEKSKYWTQLTHAKASVDRLSAIPTINTTQRYAHDVCDALATEPTCICSTCLYALSASYFGTGFTFRRGNRYILCRDCTEFRSDMEAAQKSGFRGKLPYVPWRPSRRVTVPGSGGALWYRKRT